MEPGGRSGRAAAAISYRPWSAASATDRPADCLWKTRQVQPDYPTHWRLSTTAGQSASLFLVRGFFLWSWSSSSSSSSSSSFRCSRSESQHSIKRVVDEPKVGTEIEKNKKTKKNVLPFQFLKSLRFSVLVGWGIFLIVFQVAVVVNDGRQKSTSQHNPFNNNNKKIPKMPLIKFLKP